MSDVGTAGATARDEVVMVVRNKLHVPRTNRLDLSAIDTWSLGITIVIGGQYFAWNAGLTAGFGSFLIATFFIATGYFSLIMCIAELSSALPFAGGSYGIARVTMGIFPGYLVGCFDSIESVMYVAVAAVTIGDMVTSITHWSKQYEPLYWLAFYISALLIHVWGGKSFWILNRWMAVVSFLIVLMYILGGIKYAHFSENAMWRIDDINNSINNNSTSSTISSSGTGSNSMTEDASLWFQGGALEFMKVYPLPCWFFVGVESINLACKDMVKPKRDIPRGYVSCVSTLFCTCFGVLFVAVSMNPGVPQLASELNPLNFGFVNMFGCSEEVATAISLPATYATAFGFMFCYGRQLRSMGQSGLLNQYVGKDLPVRFTPYVALILGCIIGYSFCFIIWLVPEVSSQMFNVSMLGAFGAYFSQFISFVQFRRLYESNIKRHFISPLGVPGAVYGFCVYFVAFISICGFQDNQYAIITFIAYIAAVSLYYVLVVRHRQFFSDEEKLVLFRAHLLKNNRAKAGRLKKAPAKNVSSIVAANRWKKVRQAVYVSSAFRTTLATPDTSVVGTDHTAPANRCKSMSKEETVTFETSISFLSLAIPEGKGEVEGEGDEEVGFNDGMDESVPAVEVDGTSGVNSSDPAVPGKSSKWLANLIDNMSSRNTSIASRKQRASSNSRSIKIKIVAAGDELDDIDAINATHSECNSGNHTHNDSHNDSDNNDNSSNNININNYNDNEGLVKEQGD
mmetsp:Transcript_7776/g.12901  ORF Transcript_7776/g.12901 Transcript_7776/m.12901 type:complete len:739 (+) Transcript_7776:72-2288(+)